MKILILDDSKTARMFANRCLSIILSDKKLECLEAANGEEGFSLLDDNNVDLIVSDVNMPIMNGFTFLRNLKLKSDYKDIPLIFITSLANDARAENLHHLGASAVLPKPLRPADLQVALKKLNFLSEPVEQDAWGA